MKNWLICCFVQLLIVHGEKFISEPWSELQRVEEWLGLDPIITQDNFFFNGKKVFLGQSPFGKGQL